VLVRFDFLAEERLSHGESIYTFNVGSRIIDPDPLHSHGIRVHRGYKVGRTMKLQKRRCWYE
jgi:hypothetical protein